jgi:hypothetical protein
MVLFCLVTTNCCMHNDSCKGLSFTPTSWCFNFMVFPLQHFDMILGYDWLEQFSPMKIHWGAKWISIPYGDTSKSYRTCCLKC